VFNHIIHSIIQYWFWIQYNFNIKRIYFI